MGALIESLLPRGASAKRRAMTFGEWTGLFSLENIWPGGLVPTTMSGEREEADPSFLGLVYGAYLRNSVVFSCLSIRARLFSEARFQFQQLRGGRPGNLFGTAALSVLERPERGKTTGDLLATAILDADLGGNGFLLGRPDTIRRLRPDWTTIVWGSKNRSSDLGAWDPEADVIGYGHQPGGASAGNAWVVYGPDEVAHFAPTRDPLARNRGISLLTAGLREIMADSAATSHKLRFFENAATSNLSIKFPPGMDKKKAQDWIELFEQDHRGSMNAYRTLYFGGGMEAAPVGLNFEQMTFTELQGKAETRIAALTGVHPVVAALSEGLQGSSLNSGNFGNAARLVGNATLRPLWRNMAGSLETIIPPLPGTRLWYDDRDVPFLREDIKDRAEVTTSEAVTIQTLSNSGFTKASVIDAVMADGDWNRLVDTGLSSVQLQPPLTGPAAPPPTAYRVRTTFTAGSGPADASARLPLGPLEDAIIEAGTVVPAGHVLVRAFPALFEADEPKRLAGPGLIVSRADVLNAQSSLAAAGASAGYESVARALGVSRDTVRRRLKQPATP